MFKKMLNKPINIGIAIIAEVNNSPNDKPYQEILNLASDYYEKYKNTLIGRVEGIKFARDLFKSINLDPTKYRPSSEALLRRALKKKPFPKINPAVDIGNWCSLDFLLPICVYDFNKIKGDIVLRLGEENESYLAINNRMINLHNRFVLADDIGAFGSPITDSLRTKVTDSTSLLLLVIYFHSKISEDNKSAMLNKFIDRTVKYLKGKLLKKTII